MSLNNDPMLKEISAISFKSITKQMAGKTVFGNSTVKVALHGNTILFYVITDSAFSLIYIFETWH